MHTECKIKNMSAEITQNDAQSKIKKIFIKKSRADIDQHRQKCHAKITPKSAFKKRMKNNFKNQQNVFHPKNAHSKQFFHGQPQIFLKIF